MLDEQVIVGMGQTKSPKKYFDGQGMYLYLQPSGAKYWRLKYRYEGKEKTLAIGTYPKITLEQARLKTDEAKQQLIQGIDPSEFKKNQCFEVVANEWFENEKGGWKKIYAHIVIESLKKDVYPILGKRHISAIRPPDIILIIRKIENRGALQVAIKVLQRIRAVFRYAVQTGRINRNPAIDLLGIVKANRVKHRGALKPTEIAQYIKDVNAYGGMVSTKNALRLMLLTFVRTDELRCMTWDEIDIENAIWKIPADRTKKNTPHLVPLSKQAIELIQVMPCNEERTGYLFEGRKKGLPLSKKSLIGAIYRMGYKNKSTVHGFRRVASTVLNESGRFSGDIIERQLAHIEGSAVRRAYNHAQHLPERKIMMQWWADYLDDKVQGHNKRDTKVSRLLRYFKTMKSKTWGRNEETAYYE